MLHPNGSLLLGISRNSQLQIFPVMSRISVSCISRWQGQLHFWNQEIWVRFTMAKVGSEFGFSFLCLRHVSVFVRALPRWRLARESGFKKEIKPILSVSRKKKQLFYLLIHTKNPPFFFHRKPKEVIFHSGRSCRMKREKRFFQGFFSEADAPCIPMTTEGWWAVQSLCSTGGWGVSVLNCKWTSHVFLLHSDQGDLSVHQSLQCCCCPWSGYVSISM